jgi:hypothetical protein
LLCRDIEIFVGDLPYDGVIGVFSFLCSKIFTIFSFLLLDAILLLQLAFLIIGCDYSMVTLVLSKLYFLGTSIFMEQGGGFGDTLSMESLQKAEIVLNIKEPIVHQASYGFLCLQGILVIANIVVFG